LTNDWCTSWLGTAVPIALMWAVEKLKFLAFLCPWSSFLML
jgi:hypothetical protein